MAIRNEFLDVEGELGEHFGDDACGQRGWEKCARQTVIYGVRIGVVRHVTSGHPKKT